MFSRSGAKSKKSGRRPLVAYVVSADDSEEGPAHAVYCDVYGLEMTYDNEWPLDIIPFIPAEYVCVIFEDTNVTNDGTVHAGAIPDVDAPDFRAIAQTGAKWTRVFAERPDARSQRAAAWAAGLNVLLIAETGASLARALQPEATPRRNPFLAFAASLSKAIGQKKSAESERLAVALRTKRPINPAEAQIVAEKVRGLLAKIGCAESRIVLADRAMNARLGDYLAKPDVDGVFLVEGGFGAAVDVAEKIVRSRRAR